MDVGYRVRQVFALALAVVVVARAATAAAQYMYLDADGDGVHTAADVFPSTGTVTFDVWLVTNQNRDGSPALCAQNPSSEMTINSYSFILRAQDGTVAWGGFLNHMTSFGIWCSGDSSSTDYWACWASATPLPAGAYKLATLTAQALSGTPGIDIVDSTPMAGIAITEFGSRCEGANADNTMTLGTDWFGVAGLAPSVPGNATPDFQNPVPMTVAEGDTAQQVLRANDADGQPLTFFAASPPSYMSVTTTDPGTGSATGLVRLTPGYQDAFLPYTQYAYTNLYASDGITQDGAVLRTLVTNVNRPPVLEQPEDMTVAAGTNTAHPLVTSDADGDYPYLSKVEGPEFMWVMGPYDDGGIPPHGGVRLVPGYDDEGTYAATVRVSDGSLSDQKSFQITVTPGNHPPSITQMPDVTLAAGVIQNIPLLATDPEGDPLTFELIREVPFDPLLFVTVTTVDPGVGTAMGRVDLKPTGSDLGTHILTVAVYDGMHETRMSFDVTVTAPGPSGEMSFTISGEPGDPVLGGKAIRRGGLDGTFDAWAIPQGVHVMYSANPPAPDFELAPAPARRAWCVSAQEAWSFDFQARVGDSLHVGVYPGATRTPTITAPALHVIPDCGNCGTVSGGFEVKQLQIEAGRVRSFWATFEQVCNGSGATLRGEVRFGATPPLFLTVPANRLVGVGDDVGFLVLSAPADTGQITVTGELPPGAQLVMNSWSPPRRLHGFSWKPGFSDVGVHRVVFRAVTSAGDTASTYCDIDVRARNAVTAKLDPNSIEFLTSNRGAFANDLRNDAPGLTYPKGSGIAGSKVGGLWLGAKVGGEVRVALGGAPSEFVPGPTASGAPQPFDPRFKNYKLVRGVLSSSDRTGWPREQGAPVDSFGGPLQKGDQTVWSVYNDALAAAHEVPASGSAPLGAEVRQLTWSMAHTGATDQAVFLQFRVRNASAQAWDSAYAAVRLEPTVLQAIGDLGFTFNDRVGCDSSLALGYAYSSQDTYPDGGAPPAVGVALLRGPTVRSETGTRELGMTTFRRLAGDLPFDTSGPYAVSAYCLMKGLRPDGQAVHERDDPSQPVTTLDLTGDPVTGDGWVDSGTSFYERRQFILSTGPFDLGPGEEDTIEVALVAGRGSDRLSSIRNLKQAVTALRQGIAQQTNHAPIVRAPSYYGAPDTLDINEGQLISFSVGTYDPDQDVVDLRAASLPAGASVSLWASWPALPWLQDGHFDWVPGYDQAGFYEITLVATDALGASGQDTVWVRVHDVNTTPVAHSGGPYFGAAGLAVHFDGSTSSDADANTLTGSWSFGDESSAAGMDAFHVYSNAGTYFVVLTVSDGAHTVADTTSASIAPPVQVHASAAGGMVRLAAPGPMVELTLEVEGDAALQSTLQQASFSLQSHGSGLVSAIPCVEGKTAARGDRNGNGRDELVVTFKREDVRALFCELPEGRTTTTATLTAMMGRNAVMVAPIELTIEVTHRPLAVLIAPNPINPRGVLTFTTTRPGRARVSLFDVRGRLVRHLFETEMTPAGYHDVPIDGRDANGHPLASGLYLYRIDAAEGVTSGRLTILK